MRQLESMLRLSEAYARMRCCDIVSPVSLFFDTFNSPIISTSLMTAVLPQITKAHVDEAFRLLNKSIIRVEQPDIHLDEEDEDALINAEDEEEEEPLIDGSQTPRRQVEDGPPQGMDIDDLEPLSPRPQQAKKKMRLNYDEYKSMSNLIIMYMRREENRLEEEGSDSEGLNRSQVVNWYLSEIEDDIETEEELLEKKELVEKVIDRLVHHVSHLNLLHLSDHLVVFKN